MIEPDTIRLLRECDAGVEMGISSIEDVMKYVENGSLKKSLNACKDEHQQLKTQIRSLLNEYHDEGKAPNSLAKSMSWVKTNVKLAINESDAVIADLITDGCNMGVKSLNRYLNQYEAADKQSKDVARRLISLEKDLADDMCAYL